MIAESYARIFYRNSVDGGFIIPYECPAKLNDKIKTGDTIEVDVDANTLKNISDGKTYKLNPLGDVFEIVEAGGLFAFARTAGMIS